MSGTSSGGGGHTSLTLLEQQVLDEYTRLLHNMDQLSTSISNLATTPTSHLLDSLRELERKTGLVFTLLKASVYSIVLQQQLEDEEGLQQQHQQVQTGRDEEGGGEERDEYEAGY